MKLLLNILFIFCLLGYTQALVCANNETKIKDETTTEHCILTTTIIENCTQYNSQNTSECHTCRNGATLTGTSPNITACDCTRQTFIGKDETGAEVCTTEVPNCYQYNSSNVAQCHTCFTGATPTGTSPSITACDCSGLATIISDSNGKKACVDSSSFVANCEIIKADGDGTKCNTCSSGASLTGTPPDITACDCTGKTYTDGIDENSIGICSIAEILNCSLYNSANSDQFHTCIPQAIETGTTPSITACTCDSPNLLTINEQSEPVCILEPQIISACDKYNSENLTKCVTCSAGFEPKSGQSSPLITECVCASGTTESVDENGNRICVATLIPACKQYNSGNSAKCHTCHTGYTPTGGAANLHDSCECDSPKTEKQDENSNPICVTTIVPDCKVYNSADADQCHTCLPGYAATGTSPAITACTCDPSSNTVMVDGQGNNVCIVTADLIPNCIAYNKENLAECHTCIPGSTPIGTSPNITECACASPKEVREDENSEKVCVAVIDGCTSYPSGDLTKCYSCADGYIPIGTSNLFDSCELCASPKQIKEDEASDKVCVAVIEGCESYLSTDTSKCHTCASGLTGNGSVNDHTECNCPQGQFKVIDENGDYVCAVAEISRCDKYLNSDLTKCHTCAENTIPVGPDKAYTECILCEKSIQEDENGSKICVDAISACKLYSSADNTKCHTCFEGFNGNGAGNEHTECVCDNTVGKDEDGDPLCVITSIPNCEAYNSADNSKCHTCFEGITGTGSDELFTACPCDSPSELADKKDGSKVCIVAVIEFCKTYDSPTTCDECALGFTKPDSDLSCDCAQEKQKKSVEDEDICVSEVIEKCIAYESLTTCGSCESGNSLNDGKTLCEDDDDNSSGSVVGFSIALAFLLGLIII